MNDSDEPLGPYDFPELLKAFDPLLDDHNAAIVGGQALNVWATYFYDKAPGELAQFAPYTSKDIDYYGNREAAEALANALQGDVHLPHPEDQTPHTAVAIVNLNGHRREIDFLGVLAGVPQRIISGDLATVDLAWAVDDDADVRVRLLHPLPILMSRAGNIIMLLRDDDRAVRQLQASIIVLREYLQERLDVAVENTESEGQRTDAAREAVDVAKALLGWAAHNSNARGIYEQGLGDPLAPLDAVRSHHGWDPRFLEHELLPQLKGVRERRENRWAEAARKRARRPT
ncbi:hypothetical protein [Rhodovibrio salinarum]|uniref:Uncharacterized protein n=1 Tax=Rhodovibrio salinarum TaxID=1087 RepID=A0A934QLV0_9PROT|nr:hypothetical protein [Rhodovibrio salinarum]MBK1699292.1 hypothetical protein [Rhodovibrio salinarum]